MKLPDVNVLVYAHRADASTEHASYAEWLTELATGPQKFGLSDAVLSGFVRIVTNPRVFKQPTELPQALEFCRQLRTRPQCCILAPGERNWDIFTSLCRDVSATGKLVADAWHAALAIENDCEWISTDSDFSRFPGLRWKHPLQK
jgi:toxin-antitoxin system PIN domain toxin